MKVVLVVVVLFLALSININAPVLAGNPAPVLVELFTSEGCSSCPPAEAFLRQLDATQPVPGTQAVVLSEHVDYWNHLGWKDPYSSHTFSERQTAYAGRFINDTVYTPQMVVDGSLELVGSDSRRALQIIERAGQQQKVRVAIGDLMVNGGELRAHVEVAGLTGPQAHSAGVYATLALNHAESQVLRGENEGSRLQHVAVAESITQIGSVSEGKGLVREAVLKLAPGLEASNLRLIVFVQEPGPGKVLGAALRQVSGR
jgi:hypothetical protein